MKWTEALKEYAKMKGGKYVVPRKGTPEYDEVKKLMGESKADQVKADVEHGQAKRDVKKMVKEEKAEAKAEAAPAAKEKKPRKPRAKKEKVVAPASAPVIEVKDKPARRKAKTSTAQGTAAMVALDLGGKTAVDTAKSKNPEAIFQQATNVHEPIAPPAALGGDLSELKKDIQKVRKPRALPRLIEPERVSEGVPFSFVDFKRKIGA